MVQNLQLRAQERQAQERLRIAQQRSSDAAREAREEQRRTGRSRATAFKTRNAQLLNAQAKKVEREFRVAKERRKLSEGKQTVAQLRRTVEVKKQKELEVKQKRAKDLKEISLKLEKLALKQARATKKTKVTFTRQQVTVIKKVQLKKRVIKEFKAFNTSEILLINKAVTGQTITPSEKKQLNEVIRQKGDTLTKKQISLLKNVPKDILTGLFEVGKELLTIPVTAVKSSFKFGRSLRKRFEAGENHPLFTDVNKLATGTIAVGTFVKNKPKEAAAIVALAGSAATKAFGTAFQRNPVKTTTKAFAYLFPGTVIKGGVKAAKLGKLGVTTVIQAKRLKKLEKIVKGARVGLTKAQNKKLASAVGSASKQAATKNQQQKLRTALRSILKERKVSLKKGESVERLVSKVKRSKDVILARFVEKKPPTKRPAFKFEGTKVTKISIKAVEKAKAQKLRKKRDVTKFIEIKAGKATKVTKKAFKKKIQPKTIKIPKKKTVKRLTKAQKQKQLKNDLKEQGVVSQDGVLHIDLNAVKRIENKNIAVRPIRKSKFGKKGQIQFQRQIKKQVRKTKNKIRKAKTKKELIKLKKDLLTLKNLSKVLRFLVIVALIIKLIKAIDTAIAKLPATDVAKKPAEKLKAVDTAKGSAQIPAEALKPFTPSKPKGKVIFREPTKPKKIKIKTTTITKAAIVIKGVRDVVTVLMYVVSYPCKAVVIAADTLISPDVTT